MLRPSTSFEQHTADHPLIRIGISLAIAAVVIALGFGITSWLVKTAPEAPTRQRPSYEARVDVAPVTTTTTPLSVTELAIAEPRQRLRLIAEANGTLATDIPRRRSGDRIARGEVVLRIDSPSARAAMARSEARLAQANAERRQAVVDHTFDVEMLTIEQATAALAAQAYRDEQALDGNGRTTARQVEAREQAYNQALIAVAQRRRIIDSHPERLAALDASIAAATADREEAKEVLTRLAPPAEWNAVVAAGTINPGTTVRAGEQLIDLVGAGPIDARLALAPATLRAVLAGQTPGIGPVRIETSATFIADDNGGVWNGRLARIEAQMTAATRELVAVIELEPNADMPLAIDTVGTLTLTGPPLEAWRIPSIALQDDLSLWVVDADNSLVRVEPQVWYQDQEFALIDPADAALSIGDQVVLTRLDNAYPGMPVAVNNPADQP